jgi:hypothetical protein
MPLFQDDDAGYLTWVQQHPDGFVVTKEKAGCWTRRRAFAQVRRGSNIQLLSVPFSLDIS